ncbi:MAG: acetyl-CoA carboxylase carboxyltransferase subunit alpha [bacterium]|nr:acetyl-CoA carboxylase carboxyltransferase subunit alpha [bacterium]
MADETRKPDGGPGMAFEREIHDLEDQLRELEDLSKRTQLDISSEIDSLKAKLADKLQATYDDLSAWEQVNVARHSERPVTGDYIANVFDDFIELHGDKAFGDDPAIVTGFATLAGRRLMLVGHRKGRTTKDRLQCNFGCAHPEGYRKAMRKMRLAEKLGIPILTLINTPGAYPGIGAEERGQAAAIAENILGMFHLRTPIVVVVIGEGGSGGALGIGVGDRVLMMQYAYYSVISPEGCAAILWKDGERTPDAAEALRLTAPDLSGLGLIDDVITEPLGGAHRDPEIAYANFRETIARHFDELSAVPIDELVRDRRAKFREVASIEGRFPVIA